MTAIATRTDLIDVLEAAAAIIGTNGLNKRYLYNTKQAAAGIPLAECRVDIIGALNMAAHGTPRYAATPIVTAAEQALLQRIDTASLVAWNDQPGRNEDDAVTLLAAVAAELRAEES
ncbi:DUF6197 family protein [Streptomyces sp. bgisy154]|uniref:DUF6197 family protein n=1 Tax=Streptomyces sp. bgisy154 TaxID=3413794 RepID=UPI003D754B2C